jgi:hypothetical protein
MRDELGESSSRQSSSRRAAAAAVSEHAVGTGSAASGAVLVSAFNLG